MREKGLKRRREKGEEKRERGGKGLSVAYISNEKVIHIIVPYVKTPPVQQIRVMVIPLEMSMSIR